MTKDSVRERTPNRYSALASRLLAAPAVIAFLLLSAAIPSRADSYLFSLNSSQIIADVGVANAGVYAFFLQPVGDPTLSTYLGAALPTDPSDANIQWQDGTINSSGLAFEPAIQNTGSYIYFAKAAPPAGNTFGLVATNPNFAGKQFTGAGNPATDPAAFGSTKLTFSSNVTSSGQFMFLLNVPIATQSFKFYAAYLDAPDNLKVSDTALGTIQLTGTAPEPGTVLLFVAGLGLILLAKRIRRTV